MNWKLLVLSIKSVLHKCSFAYVSKKFWKIPKTHYKLVKSTYIWLSNKVCSNFWVNFSDLIAQNSDLVVSDHFVGSGLQRLKDQIYSSYNFIIFKNFFPLLYTLKTSENSRSSNVLGGKEEEHLFKLSQF